MIIKVFYIKLITNSITGIVVAPCVHLSVPNGVTPLNLKEFSAMGLKLGGTMQSAMKQSAI